jgi:hypothetical protein
MTAVISRGISTQSVIDLLNIQGFEQENYVIENEIVSETDEKVFFTWRTFPTDEILRVHEWGQFENVTQVFYDDSTHSKMQNNKFYKREGGEIVHQYSVGDDKHGTHFYRETIQNASVLESNDLKEFLRLEFDRRTVSYHDESGCHVTLRHDVVRIPIYYELLTWKIDITELTAENAVNVVTKYLSEIKFIPMYTKFYYAIHFTPTTTVLLQKQLVEKFSHIEDYAYDHADTIPKKLVLMMMQLTLFEVSQSKVDFSLRLQNLSTLSNALLEDIKNGCFTGKLGPDEDDYEMWR